MGRDDAGAALGLELVDPLPREHAIERLDVVGVGGREPVLDVRSARNVIRHAWIDFEHVQALKGEVPDVADDISANVPPKEFRPFLVAFIEIGGFSQENVAQPPHRRRAEALRTPVEILAVLAVIAEEPRVMSELAR